MTPHTSAAYRPTMGNKDKGRREARKPKKSAKQKGVPVTPSSSSVIPTIERPMEPKPKD